MTSARKSRFSDAPIKRFKASDTDDHKDVLAKIDEKLNNVDVLLAGFDNPKNPLNFIPSSVNKSSSANTKSSTHNATATPNPEVTKTITITATSFKIEHHTEDDQNAATPPIGSVPKPPNLPEPIALRPLPPPDAKPAKSVLLKSKSTTFREAKRKRRSKTKESESLKSKSK